MTIRYPWPTFISPLRCELTDIRLDGTPLRTHFVDHDHLRVRLDTTEGWDQFDCDVTVNADEPRPAGLNHLRGFVLVSSTPTNTRMPFALGEADDLPATGHLTVARSTVAGSFTVQAETGAHVGGRHRIVGAGDPWTVVLDHREAPVPPGAPPFDISWVDFTAPDAPTAAQANPGSHALMDLETEPRLLLNSGIEGLQTLLYNTGAQKERRRMREILSSSVARYATTVLFRAATAEIAAYDDDSPPNPPSSAILRQTCEAVAEHMSGIGSVEELYELICAAADGPSAFTAMWLRVDPAIDTLTHAADALSAAAEAVAHG